VKTLVAIDGSEASFAALTSACRIAVRTRSYVTAIYVNKSAEYTGEETGWPQLKEKIDAELEARGQQIMRRAGAIGSGLGIEVEGIMAYGVPAEELARYAADRGIVNLVALGHSSKGRGAQGFVGSTARLVISLVDRASVLVTSREEEISTILIAVDDTEASMKTAVVAGRLAQALAADVRVISIFPDIDVIRDEYRQIAEVPNLDKYLLESKASLRARADQAVEKAHALLSPLGLKVTVAVKQGYPPKELVEESVSANLTAIGLKQKPERKKIGRTLGRLLDHHEISLLCVQ
jgi:nucleotide-binding universal stress UspA family protein